MLRLSRAPEITSVLGPGRRGVLFLQGCNRRCKGCITPESWLLDVGIEYPIGQIIKWFLSLDITGLTITGGEPMLQAMALMTLISSLRTVRDINVVCYTGFHLEELLATHELEQISLLAEIDLLIDGPYDLNLHKNLLWRGSANQRLILLTERIKCTWEDSTPGVGVEFSMLPEGGISFVGIPPMPYFRRQVEQYLLGHDIKIGRGTDERDSKMDIGIVGSNSGD